jgi:hypothetical protein
MRPADNQKSKMQRVPVSPAPNNSVERERPSFTFMKSHNYLVAITIQTTGGGRLN